MIKPTYSSLEIRREHRCIKQASGLRNQKCGDVVTFCAGNIVDYNYRAKPDYKLLLY